MHASTRAAVSPHLQHPEKSLDVRDIAAKLGRKKRYGVAGKVGRSGRNCVGEGVVWTGLPSPAISGLPGTARVFRRESVRRCCC